MAFVPRLRCPAFHRPWCHSAHTPACLRTAAVVQGRCLAAALPQLCAFGWEQAEAEAWTLKLQLETVTLSKLAAEERAAHLDGALKECMKQVRTVKEEGELKLHDVVLAKATHWEKIRNELETKLVEFEQDLIRAAAENDALSRSLEEKANLLLKVNEEKAKAEAQIELLKSTIQSGDKEINSLKYELHVVAKELDIRNEEKNMSVRSADVATKQHAEDVKKISKLEAECQRLRGLVRKNLPGPAALAQMKMEVDSWGRDPGDNKMRRSPSRSSMLQYPMSPSPDCAHESMQRMQKENELLTARLLSMDEETKMLKDALSKCNQELQASKNMCAKTSSKLRSMELNMSSSNLYKSPTNSYVDTSASSQKGSNPPSLTSMSEDGVDDARSCEESWANTLVSELSYNKKYKGGKHNLTENSNQMSLMDDFLEMERLACLSSEAQECEGIVEKKSDVVKVLDGIRNILADIQHEVESVNINKLEHDDMFEVTGQFSTLVDEVVSDGNGLKQIVIALSEILVESGEFKVILLRKTANEGQSPSDAFDVKTTVQMCALEEYEKLRLEKRNLEMEVTKCNDMMESANLKFCGMEKNIEDLTSKLAACEKSNSLAETQLKCMAESYKTLESQKVKLEEEIRVLQAMIDTLSADLAEERRSHQDDMTKYRDLEEKMERYEKSSLFVTEEPDVKLKKVSC
nr:unnamed protein product [Digitaria exilis]CAB3494946.1 unnamed protein product [Digitaria exilis]CAB3494980.1 unnamed protein product [Digitaria exilis]